MTKDELLKEGLINELTDFCDYQYECDTCPLSNLTSCGFYKMKKEELEKYYDMITKHKQNEVAESNSVNHPKHYNREGAMECIDEMVLIFGVEAVKCFCICNSWKYRYRASDKNGEQDLLKSDWYLKKYKELRDGEENL